MKPPEAAGSVCGPVRLAAAAVALTFGGGHECGGTVRVTVSIIDIVWVVLPGKDEGLLEPSRFVEGLHRVSDVHADFLQGLAQRP